MALTERVRGAFPKARRDHGRSHFARGAVRITESKRDSVRATVAGRESYVVRVWLSGDSLGVSCTCPLFCRASDPCEHIWAVILAADAGHHLAEAAQDALSSADGESDLRWRQRLALLGHGVGRAEILRDEGAPEREIAYLVNVPASRAEGRGVVVEVADRRRKRDGEWTRLRPRRVPLRQLSKIPDPADRRILALLLGAQGETSASSPGGRDLALSRFHLVGPLPGILIPEMCRTGRCRLRLSEDQKEPELLERQPGGPWELRLELHQEPGGEGYVLEGSLRRGAESRLLSAPILLPAGEALVFEDGVAALADPGTLPWVEELRGTGAIRVPRGELAEMLEQLVRLPRVPRVDLPAELQIEEVYPRPRPWLKLGASSRSWRDSRVLGGLHFDYDGVVVAWGQLGSGVYQAAGRRLVFRDAGAENGAATRLRELGFKPSGALASEERDGFELAAGRLAGAARTLVEEGWRVDADGKPFRTGGVIHIEVSSGIDWFDLRGTADFGQRTAPLPDVLAAIRRGETTVILDDGSLGLLPEDWPGTYALLASLGLPEHGRLRFRRNQVGLLDALLASQDGVDADAVFTKARQQLRTFDGIEPLDAGPGFRGRLRGYQREGLGWFRFLRRFGFGGCLADDMGLGKTVQVLALLESRRRTSPDGRPPSLVVVPRSLIFNWKQEARRFTPKLRFLDHTGPDRPREASQLEKYDLVLTTYGTLRRDVLLLKDVTFDYAILDEAQAIKNPRTGAAKASRLLRADQRLALSGTPVENHVGELWSVLEFLNPGMLGRASGLRNGAAGVGEATQETLARALRPFILRRTKKQVAKELPSKLEQTLYCELETKQRRLYDDLREHYRSALLDQVEREGLGRAKLQILEALLRLRQAACHPGLIDRNRAGESSAKLDMLLPQLAAVLDEGHKALVFSQFTSFLRLVRERLDEAGIRYEYLDGRTRDRESRVRRFQEQPDPRVFLISLKAGGLGLNLTAAEYVFLLDPWWNPAVETQAIDRTHRIGQRRRVFAYRLIARDTVEEKVLELQGNKRRLAEAIITADNSLIRELGHGDLQVLLS